MKMLKPTKSPHFYETEDKRFCAIKSTRRAGEPGYRYTETSYSLFDGDKNLGYFRKLSKMDEKIKDILSKESK